MVYIKRNTYIEIMRFFEQNNNCEKGGIVGCFDDRNVIEHFFADRTACNTFNTYVPDVIVLNRQIEYWEKRKIHFCGMIHMHLTAKTELSEGDIRYAKRILEAFENISWLWFPVVAYIYGTKKLFMYKVKKTKRKKEVFVISESFEIY